MSELRIFGITGVGEISPGDDLAEILYEAAAANHGGLADGDVLAVTQKVVSKAEGALVAIDPTDPQGHRPVVEAESVRILRRRGDLVISETRHGFICANAGVDLSNVEAGYAALLPADSDRSARRIRDALSGRHGLDVAVIVTDTFGRPWRSGLTDVAIGCAGIGAILDHRGQTDALGRELHVTQVAVVDELAGAADLVLGKSSGMPAAVIRGVDRSWFRRSDVRSELIRDPSEDLFR